MYYVEIVAYKNDRVAKRMGPFSERKAERVDGGANINLDHENFYTRIVDDVDQRTEDEHAYNTMVGEGLERHIR